MRPDPHTPDALPARPPDTTPAVRKAEGERDSYLRGREHLERRSMWRGLLLLALCALLIGLYRAGAERALYTGWWRHW